MRQLVFKSIFLKWIVKRWQLWTV